MGRQRASHTLQHIVFQLAINIRSHEHLGERRKERAQARMKCLEGVGVENDRDALVDDGVEQLLHGVELGGGWGAFEGVVQIWWLW